MRAYAAVCVAPHIVVPSHVQAVFGGSPLGMAVCAMSTWSLPCICRLCPATVVGSCALTYPNVTSLVSLLTRHVPSWWWTRRAASCTPPATWPACERWHARTNNCAAPLLLTLKCRRPHAVLPLPHAISDPWFFADDTHHTHTSLRVQPWIFTTAAGHNGASDADTAALQPDACGFLEGARQHSLALGRKPLTGWGDPRLVKKTVPHPRALLRWRLTSDL